jgi:hypothetical protein
MANIFDKIAALADGSALGEFDGKPVLQASTKLRNAGDGLSKSMKIQPILIHQGDEVYTLTKSVCTEVSFEPIDKDDPTGPQRRVAILRAGTQTIVDESVAKAQIEAQEFKIREAIEKAKGIEPLPGVADAEKAAAAKKAAKPKSAAKRTGKAEAEADPGKNPPPPAPMGDGPHDDDGFHDPTLAEPAPVADLAKAAAKKLAAK